MDAQGAKPLPVELKPLLNELAEELQARLGFLPPLWLFGSWARGTATEGSDVDIAVILPQWRRDLVNMVWDVAWEVGFRHNRVLSLIPITQEEWEHPELLDLVSNVWREGIPIWLPKGNGTEQA